MSIKKPTIAMGWLIIEMNVFVAVFVILFGIVEIDSMTLVGIFPRQRLNKDVLDMEHSKPREFGDTRRST